MISGHQNMTWHDIIWYDMIRWYSHRCCWYCLIKYLIQKLYLCKDGVTALMRAAYSGYSDIVGYLIETGAEVNVTDKVSKWLSMYTCVCVCVCVCLILLPWNCFIIEYSHYHQFLHFYYYLFLLRMITLY